MQDVILEQFKLKMKQLRQKMSTFDAYFTKGSELFEEKKYEIAIEFLKIALSQDNAQPLAYYNLALAYQKLDRIDEAIENYELYLEAYPNDEKALYNAATIYFSREEYKLAAKYFLKSFESKIEENTVTALCNTYLKLKDAEKVYELGEYIINSDCDNKFAFTVAKTLEDFPHSLSDLTFLKKALAIYEKLLEVSPRNFDAILSISLVYSKMGDWTNAIEYCSKALEISPDSYDANNQMGLVYYCADNLEESINYYEKAFKINSKTDYKIYTNLAYAYDKAGKTEQAIELLKETVLKFPNCPIKEELKKHAHELVKKSKK